MSDETVNIEKKGFLTGKRNKTILIRNITSVEVKRPGAFSGFIQFSIAGGAVRDSSFKFTGGAFDAAGDENSVVFTGQDNYKVALQVKAHVEAWSSNQQRSNAQPALSVADEIRALKALVDDGLLTAEEFDAKKKQLLGISALKSPSAPALPHPEPMAHRTWRAFAIAERRLRTELR